MTAVQALPLAYALTGVIYWVYSYIKTKGWQQLLVSNEFPLLVRVCFFFGRVFGEGIGLIAAICFWPACAYFRKQW